MGKYRILLVIVFCFVVQLLNAKDVTGKVVDTEGNAIPFANIVVLSEKDSAYVAGFVADVDGKFSLSTAPENAIFKISCLGYESRYLGVADLSLVRLENAALHVGEVVVNGTLPVMKQTSEGYLTNVMGSKLSKMGTANDVLSHVPGVYKDDNGYVVLGSGKPVIYLNGHKVFGNSELERLKSENIKSVEVIANPGAKYDAEVNSIIKIVSKKNVLKGLGMDFRSKYEQSRMTNLLEQVGWTYNVKQLSFFGNHEYQRNAYYNDHSLLRTIDANTFATFDMQMCDKSHFHNFSNTLGVNWQVNDNISLGGKYSFDIQPSVSNGANKNTTSSVNGAVKDKLSTYTQDRDKAYTHQANAYFSGEWGKYSLEIDVDYYYGKNDTKSFSREESAQSVSRDVNTKNLDSNRLLATKIVAGYGNGNVNFQFGGEYTMAKSSSSYDNLEKIIEASNSLSEEKHWATFGEMSISFPMLKLLAGLRHEFVWSDYFKDGINVSEQSKRYSNFFPSLSVSTRLEGVNFKLGYSLKTLRPAYSYLSGAVSYSDRYSYYAGNPLLKQEYVHRLNLTVFGNVFRISANYTSTKNAIFQWAELYEGTADVSLTTYKNYDNLKKLAIVGVLSSTFGCWSPTLQASFNKQWFDVECKDGVVHLDKPMGRFLFSNVVDFGHQWQGVFDFNYATRGHSNVYYNARCRFNTYMSISKSWLDDKLRIQLSVTDLFGDEKSEQLRQAYQISTHQVKWMDNRSVALTVRYKFNSLKNHYKGNGAGDEEKDRF